MDRGGESFQWEFSPPLSSLFLPITNAKLEKTTALLEGNTMVNRSHAYPGWQVLLLLLVVGGIIGGWLGDFIVGLWPALGILGKTQSVGIPDFTLNLQVFSLTFGFMLHISFFTLLGFVLSYLVYKRL